jgi:hypothetical protein
VGMLVTIRDGGLVGVSGTRSAEATMFWFVCFMN